VPSSAWRPPPSGSVENISASGFPPSVSVSSGDSSPGGVSGIGPKLSGGAVFRTEIPKTRAVAIGPGTLYKDKNIHNFEGHTIPAIYDLREEILRVQELPAEDARLALD